MKLVENRSQRRALCLDIICLFTQEINVIDVTLMENHLHRKSKSHLSKHMLIHSRDKPHKCANCGKSFTQKVHLSTHMLIHSGSKGHRCDLCGNKFPTTRAK